MKPTTRSETTYTIGQVAKLSGIGIETIRFYEREGVIPKPPRTDSGYRKFGGDILKRLHFIQRAQSLGFSLKEISQLIAMRVTTTNCEVVRKKAVAKLEEIEGKITDLKKMQARLNEVTQACVAHKPIADCPILNSFDD